MNITYREDRLIASDELRDLFLSVEWASGHYEEKLAKAIQNSDTVFTAWNGERLVGLINALDDGSMTAYIHFLLVRPEYQDKGIGRKLMELTKETYRDYLRIVLVSYDKQVKFYQRCGFQSGEDETPMFLTSLWN
jgi:ribosomal protein S18 acetylase RimI-like enzyme